MAGSGAKPRYKFKYGSGGTGLRLSAPVFSSTHLVALSMSLHVHRLDCEQGEQEEQDHLKVARCSSWVGSLRGERSGLINRPIPGAYLPLF